MNGDDAGSHLQIDVTVDDDVSVPLQIELLKKAAKAAADHRGFTTGEIGIRVTDDPCIREINAKHLNHDYATDVISFGYRAEANQIEGEMVISVDTARTQAIEIGWSTDHELCLYVVHGTLHITGMDDHSESDRREMRQAESAVMGSLGIDQFDRFSVDRDFGGTNANQECER